MRRRAYAALLLVVLVLTGCANIPEESTPHAVRDDQELVSEAPPESPTANLNPFDLVREFVRRSGNPAAARMYLTKKAQSAWVGESKPTVIHNTFGTVPLQNDNNKQAGEDQGGVESTRVTVLLRVTLIGRLGGDNAFVPAIGEDEFKVGVLREKGQWRIDEPPPGVYVPLADFNVSYRPVTVYFFDPDLRIIVPDQRYVAAEPESGLPNRVMLLLLNGPSDQMNRSLVNLLDDVGSRTNVVPDPDDGTLVVDLVPLGDKSEEQRELIAAQIVLTLASVTSSRLRIKGDGQDLIRGHGDWRTSDLEPYDAATKPSSDQQGLVTSEGRLRTLQDGKPIDGPAGSGEYDVVSAAQSIDGGQLAVVTRAPDGLRLRIGPFGEAMQEVDLTATTMTRPTWRVSTAEGQEASEVWTVEDGNVVRVVRTPDDVWKSVQVNATDIDTFGQIQQLRLSRDGTRAAMIMASGKLVVAAVVRDKDSVSLSNPRALQPTVLVNAVGVDWLNQHTMVVVTAQTQLPVLSLSVDGLATEAYDANNLQFPMRAVAAAPEREVVVTDNAAVLVAPAPTQVWRQLQNGQGSTAIPLYPG